MKRRVLTPPADRRRRRVSAVAHSTDFDLLRALPNLPGVVYRRRRDTEWAVEFFGDSAHELLGAPPDALTTGGTGFEWLVHSNDLQRVRLSHRRAIEGRTPICLEYRLSLPNGQTRWVCDRAWPLLAADGAVSAFEGLLTDITRQKLADSREEIRAEIDEMSARHAPLEVILEALVAWVDQHHETARGIIHSVDLRDRRCRLVAGPGIPTRLRAALNDLPLDGTASCIGLAGLSGRRSVTGDFATEPGCPQTRALALSLGFRSAWSEPIVGGDGGVRGTWTQFQREPGLPNDAAILEIQWATRVALDLIDRRFTQANLESSERFRAATLNALTSRIAVIDSEGSIVATNRAWREFAAASGLSWESVSEGVSYLGVCEQAMAAGDADAARMHEMIRRVLTEECEAQEFGYACHSPVENRWFRCRVSRFAFPGPPRVVIAHEDVTETHLALEAAQRSRSHFHSLFEFAPDALLMVDDAGLIVKVNRQAELIFGWPRDELVGRTIETLMPESARHSHVRQRGGFLEARAPRAMGQGRGVLRALRRDGSVFPVDISLGPLETEAGRMVLAAVRDVAERTRVDRRMREALTALDAMSDAAVIFDVERFALDFVNEAAVRLFGLSREELLTKSLVDFMSRQWSGDFRAAIRSHLDSASAPTNILTRFGNADGVETAVEVSVRPVDGEDGHVRCIAVIRDITQRVAEERAARRSQRLESIGTLAGGVAHDLNNALTPIVMGLDALRTDYPTESDLLQTMETSARRAAGMIRQLLTFAKGAEGTRVSFALSPVLTELEAIIRATFPKSIRIRIVADRSLPSVLGDATQIHQVLMNLSVNARDAMPEGGDLLIQAKRTQCRLSGTGPLPMASSGEFVYLRITDTGAGIPAHHIDKIFDPFFTTKGPDKGTGLGLSTALGIIQAHGGLMDVDTSVGRGTTFHVYLPVAGDTESGEFGQPGLHELHGNGRVVLMVDDEPNVREVGRHTLEAMGFTVVLADDGLDALLRIAEKQADFSLVITDLSMPELDGMAFIRRLRRLRPELPVVVMSGHFSQSVGEEIATLRRIARLDKPFSRDELAVVLHHMLAPGVGETT